MKKKKQEISIVRSSAAEYLTFITATGESDVNAVYCDENVWLTQKMMGFLYNVETHTINYHLKKLFSDGEIEENSVIRKFRITAADGKNYNTNHYNLSAIIAVGNKVDSPRAVQFRKWANQIIEEFTVKGFAMDDERLKNGGTVLTKDYFREQLERIREIRLSERRFYQKITDIYATSIDYDSKAETTKKFFARVQNQLHWAIHGETAAETIYHRADSTKANMGLSTWKDAPDGKIQRFDVVVAKNYLTKEELSAMARIVNAYLDLAELRAEEEVPMTMEDWAEQFEGVLRLSRKEILTGAGTISAKVAQQHAL
ncbi:MAG: virulence RhuM family protein, partial [Blautia producta]